MLPEKIKARIPADVEVDSIHDYLIISNGKTLLTRHAEAEWVVLRRRSLTDAFETVVTTSPQAIHFETKGLQEHLCVESQGQSVRIPISSLERKKITTALSAAEDGGVSIPRPDLVQVNDVGEKLVIKRNWPLARISVVQLALGVIFSSGGLLVGGEALALLAVGLVLIYVSAADILNRTTITVTDQQLSFRHGPVPMPGNRRLSRSELEQLYCKEVVQHSYHGSIYKTYELHAITTAGEDPVVLLKRLHESEVRYLERAIEDYLGIVDVPVPGELPK